MATNCYISFKYSHYSEFNSLFIDDEMILPADHIKSITLHYITTTDGDRYEISESEFNRLKNTLTKPHK